MIKYSNFKLNEKRISEKRPTEIKDKERIVQPFDDTKFNFTRINKNEVFAHFDKLN